MLFECDFTKDDHWPYIHKDRHKILLEVSDILADKTKGNEDYLKRIFMRWDDKAKRKEELMGRRAKPLRARRGT